MSTEQRGRETTDTLERVTVRYDGPLVARVEAVVEAGEYPNRSEAFRDLVARGLADVEDDAGE